AEELTMPTLTQQDAVYVLDLTADESNPENRFSQTWMVEVEEALDAVVSSPAPLVGTATGKFFSNGLDLDWLMANLDELAAYTARVQTIFARVLTLPVPTAAAVNGHAFGAGAMLAMAFDWRYMREDKGFFCFPEVDIQIPFSPGMASLIQSKLTPRAALDSMSTGRRYGATDADAAGIIDGAAPEDGLLAAAVAQVAPLAGKSADTLGKIKATMYAEVVQALAQS
ncbi:MAG: enoyl-CoA hydratase-related protein, partial [Marmoricola sp.]